MVINDEILAAYVDGTLPQDQVEEVRQYLASHPQELEQLVRVMDTNPITIRRDKQSESKVSMGRTYSVASKVYPSTSTYLESKRNPTILKNIDSLFKEVF